MLKILVIENARLIRYRKSSRVKVYCYFLLHHCVLAYLRQAFFAKYAKKSSGEISG